MSIRRLGFVWLAVSAALVGCSNVERVQQFPDDSEAARSGNPYSEEGESVFGGDGLSFGFGGDEQSNQEAIGGSGLGVNGFLWRASLDTISFMPVNSADPFGGVIITDWHSIPEAPEERFKMNVYILGRALRADGVRVAVFRQVRDPETQWVDASVNDDTGPKIEDAILVRARQLRFAALQQ